MKCYYKGYTIIKTIGKPIYNIQGIDDKQADTMQGIKRIIDDISKSK